jgi:hypothetical protein
MKRSFYKPLLYHSELCTNGQLLRVQQDEILNTYKVWAFVNLKHYSGLRLLQLKCGPMACFKKRDQAVAHALAFIRINNAESVAACQSSLGCDEASSEYTWETDSDMTEDEGQNRVGGGCQNLDDGGCQNHDDGGCQKQEGGGCQKRDDGGCQNRVDEGCQNHEDGGCQNREDGRRQKRRKLGGCQNHASLEGSSSSSSAREPSVQEQFLQFFFEHYCEEYLV